MLDELSSTFATRYTAEVALNALFDPAVPTRANAKAIGAKYLVHPQG